MKLQVENRGGVITVKCDPEWVANSQDHEVAILYGPLGKTNSDDSTRTRAASYATSVARRPTLDQHRGIGIIPRFAVLSASKLLLFVNQTAANLEGGYV